MAIYTSLIRPTQPRPTAVDWNSPTWGSNPVHVASYVDAEPMGRDQ